MTNPSQQLPDGTLVLEQPIRLPDVLDVLIVGGGPAGTAAAFRAKELGLAALVIDYDDLMKRIRDYAKDKPILPSFGGGDQMQFPEGGELVSQLAFEPIQKDEICARWKTLYRQHSVPARLGIELTALERNLEGVWNATVWNHNSEEQDNLFARSVIISIGRGVPRRLDIPGNVDGISRRLSDPELYVEGPVCVIGGGTSAAEAVIAISSAKKKARNACDVYWSYRGDRMPKVSKALSEPFFAAYVGNGNIRYLPHSEPVAVVTDADQGDLVCIRTDRKLLSDRPVETVQLEFPKASCIACIGEDVPERLLNSFGVYRSSGGPHNRQRFVVSPLMETVQPNLFLAGDLLSPAYLETEDFEADPGGFREVKRRGNIKSALRDGVLVADVVAQKLAGETDIHVRLSRTEQPKPAATTSTQATQPAPHRLIRLLDGETTAEEFPLNPDNETTIGTRGDIRFEEDSRIAPTHAVIRYSDNEWMISDRSGEGLFVRPAEGRKVRLERGTAVRAGRQWLLFSGEADSLRMIHYDSQGAEVKRYSLSEGTKLVVGRDADITLDRKDGSLSRRHFSVTLQGGQVTCVDLRSTNGIWLKADGPTPLREGDRILIGHQTLLFSGGEEPVPEVEVRFKTHPPAPATPAADESTAGQAAVKFKNSGQSFAFRKGQTICELAEEQGVSIKAQCHQGICGSDPIRVLSGQDNLNPKAEGESDALEDLCGLEGDEYRLACLARPRGPVEVEILEND